MDSLMLFDLINSWLTKEMARRVIDVGLLLLAGLVVQEILVIITGRYRKRLEGEGRGSENVKALRAKTITNVLFTTISVAGWVILLFMVLDRLGVNITPLLASAGVLGLAISFGSQELVRDFLAGFFFLLEGQFNVGDIVEMKGKKGQVADMSFRTVTIKELESGTVHIFRNSQVDIVSRFNKKAELEALEQNSQDGKK